jgi:histidine ammonia-lyase
LPSELAISERTLELSEVLKFSVDRTQFSRVTVSAKSLENVKASHAATLGLLERGIAVYGVTTGFGDSSFRLIPAHQSEILQANLVSYLLCGTGPLISREASRAMFLFRLNSLCRGLSGVSPDLIERMRLFLEKDLIPAAPREGSLGASGDLIPLAYLAQVLQGEGRIYCGDKIRKTSEVLAENGIAPYKLKTKEGLALVNGTSAMAGLALVNVGHSRRLLDLTCVATSWSCIALQGRTESFEPLINEVARSHGGQSLMARSIRRFLSDESYVTRENQKVGSQQSEASAHVQERYSLRCAPQILGPVVETIALVESWLQAEVNSVSDNPLVSGSGELATGGNFYGGYLTHGMDYLKISLANVADMIDRQLMLIIDDKTNRGLPPNLAAWNKIPEDERFLHHGLKGLHQAVSAVTAEILNRATPNSLFSRSSESHNQDKVSMGMGGAVQCSEIIDSLYSTMTMYLISLAQALDLRGVALKGRTSKPLYDLIRSVVPFIDHDQALGDGIGLLRTQLQNFSVTLPE